MQVVAGPGSFLRRSQEGNTRAQQRRHRHEQPTPLRAERAGRTKRKPKAPELANEWTTASTFARAAARRGGSACFARIRGCATSAIPTGIAPRQPPGHYRLLPQNPRAPEYAAV